MSRYQNYKIECPCGAVFQGGPDWWVEFRSVLHDLFSGPKLRAFHAKAENETRKRLGLPPA